ncbi:hypothetical protein [Paracoccus benzoatiresistens]|uniref:Uncharacterized protein n=1 Tax=Paracoccus benzoatiresistens TaxID=2997341 RepID=A0ABT4J8Z9_9RHOB|nr:hypothetical protein [Paracoccus sp. EF6]MCZ0963072.1 hypothetical protein [Paracoccus sp. EF6]
MRDKLDPADPALQGYETSVRGQTETQLHLWVSACLEDSVQELDRMIVTAPSDLRMAYPCYDSMADEIEITVQRIWWDIAIRRMRAGH